MGYNGNDRPIPPALLFYTQHSMRPNLMQRFKVFRLLSGRSEGVYTFQPGDRVTLQAGSYDYVIQKSLASGGLGETYIAHHVRDTNQKVVIKFAKVCACATPQIGRPSPRFPKTYLISESWI